MSGLSEDTRALLDAARDGDDPSEADRARVRGALARKIALGAAAGVAVATASHVAGGATSAAAGAVSAGTATAATAGTVATASIAAGAMGGGTAAAIVTSLGAKIIVSVAIVSAVGAGTATYVKHEAAKRAVPTVSAAAPVTPSRSAAAPARVAAPVVAAAPVVIPPVVAAAPPAPVPVATAPAAAPTTSPLDAEVAMLQEAHAALRANDGDRALRAVAEHGRRFPGGQLGEEFEATRVFALCELGRADEARDVASRFLREHPRSPLAPRVANACESNAPSTF
jgi:hypothetical protein